MSNVIFVPKNGLKKIFIYHYNKSHDIPGSLIFFFSSTHTFYLCFLFSCVYFVMIKHLLENICHRNNHQNGNKFFSVSIYTHLEIVHFYFYVCCPSTQKLELYKSTTFFFFSINQRLMIDSGSLLLCYMQYTHTQMRYDSQN